MVVRRKNIDIKRIIKKRIELNKDKKIVYLNKKNDINNILQKRLKEKNNIKMNDRDKLRIFGDKNNNNNLNKNDFRVDAGKTDKLITYEKYEITTLSILIVNLNNLDLTKNCIKSLELQINQNFKIYLFDQDSDEKGTELFLKECENNKNINIEVIRNNENIPLNHLWSNFKNLTNDNYLCFLNNDTILSNTFVDDTIKILDKEPTVGAVIHATNNPKYLKSLNILSYEVFKKPLYQGWDFTIRKNLIPEIPKSMLIFGGDDYIFAKLNTLGYKTAIAYSSPDIHFKEKTRVKISNIDKIQFNDGQIFRSLISDEKLIQIDSTLNHGYSFRIPLPNMSLTQNKKCIYTATIGDYDNIIPTPYKKLDDWDYICFTDNKKLKSDFWRIVYINNTNETNTVENVKLARFFKTNYHKYLMSYEYVMWMDARITVVDNINKYLNMLGNNDIIFLKHPDASNINEEFKRVLKGNIETKEMIDNLRTRYKKENYNYDNGLISSGILLFRNNEKIIKFFKEWWYEIKNYSHRDQLSANYVLWKNQSIRYEMFSGMIGKFFRQLPRRFKPFRYE